MWAPNQRGYGLTSRPARWQSYSIENLMADVVCLILASGAEHVVLLGHDWGAIVAWCLASRMPHLLEPLIIINVPHPVCFARSLRRPAQLLRSWYALAFQVPLLPERLLQRDHARPVVEAMLRSSTSSASFPRDLLAATRANAAQPGALTAMINWYRAFIRDGRLRRQLRLGFPPIEIPPLMLWGMEDRFLANFTTDGAAAFVRHLTLKFLPGVSHWVQQDASAECNKALQDFLPDLNKSA